MFLHSLLELKGCDFNEKNHDRMMCETSKRLAFGSRGLKYLEIVIRLINGAFYYKRISVVIMNNYAARDVENRSGHRNALLYCTMDSLQFWFNFF